MCRIAGEDTIYLHLRFQDVAASELYRRGGFEEMSADPWAVKLLGLDRRRLMRKRLTNQVLEPAAVALEQRSH